MSVADRPSRLILARCSASSRVPSLPLGGAAALDPACAPCAKRSWRWRSLQPLVAADGSVVVANLEAAFGAGGALDEFLPAHDERVHLRAGYALRVDNALPASVPVHVKYWAYF